MKIATGEGKPRKARSPKASVPAKLENESSSLPERSITDFMDGQTSLSADEQKEAIAQAAYYRAARRGFEPGYDLDDWLAAEREVASVCGDTLEKTRADIS